MKLQQWITRVMMGRNGSDALSRFLSALTIFLLLLSLIAGQSVFSSIFWIFAVVCLAASLYRSFSRKLEQRRRENAAYLRVFGKAKAELQGVRSRFRQRKDYRFFRCPSCRSWLRVPRGKGKIHITCRQCGERFTRNT